MSPFRVLAVAALVAVAVVCSAGTAAAQHCNARVVGQGYVAPAAHSHSYGYNAVPYTPTYYAPVVRKTIVVQQDYVVEPQVSEVVEILDAKQFRASGLNYGYYGHDGYYPDKVAVIREVVQRKTIVIPASPQEPAGK